MNKNAKISIKTFESSTIDVLLNQILNRFDSSSLQSIPSITELAKLTNIDAFTDYGFKRSEALKLMAVLELSKRLMQEQAESKIHLKDPSAASDYLISLLRYKTTEEFWVIYLNNHNKIIYSSPVFKGNITTCPVEPRNIFKTALNHNASAIIIAHNHISGETEPSPEDIHLTEKIKCAGQAIGIPLIDHIIVSDDNYFSFREQGIF